MGKNVIICHADGHKLGIASNHGDIYHWFKKHGKTMDDVRKDVKSIMETKAETPKEIYRVRKSWDDAKSQLGAYSVLANAKVTADKNAGYYVFDSKGNVVYPVTTPEVKSFKVQVSITNLNIRKGPSHKKYASVGRISKGVYTIVETKKADGFTWGKLKSGAGWIALEYVKRV
jgi:hypothetical protein